MITGTTRRGLLASALLTSALLASALLASALLVGLAGCYVGAGDESLDAIIELKVEPTTELRANGSSVIQLQISVDPDTDAAKPITVTTSSGVLDFAADPSSADARKVTLANAGGSGQLKVPLRVGREPGTTLLSASLVGVRAEASLQLGVALPAQLQLDPGATTIVADGTSKLTIKLRALASQDASFSTGLLARLAICCDSQGAPSSCPALPPLTGPQSVSLADDGSASFDLLSRPWELRDQTPRTFWVLAEVSEGGPGEGVDLCAATPAQSARRAQRALLVTPPSPPSP
jgi:hypothetical protein